MKTFSKKELTEKAAPVFKNHPKAGVLYATTDGQFFLNKNRRDLHANASNLGIYDISRDESPLTPEGGTEPKLPSVAKLKDLVAEIDDEDELSALLETEKNGENRKTAVAAIEERIAETSAKASASEGKSEEVETDVSNIKTEAETVEASDEDTADADTKEPKADKQ